MPRSTQQTQAASSGRIVGGSITRPSDQNRAARSMTTHSFHPAIGYLEHSHPPIVHNGAAPAPQCDPPLGVRDGSRHMLAFGDKQLSFTWVAAEQAWARAGGHRMAFTAEYLTREGWRYVGPALN